MCFSSRARFFNRFVWCLFICCGIAVSGALRPILHGQSTSQETAAGFVVYLPLIDGAGQATAPTATPTASPTATPTASPTATPTATPTIVVPDDWWDADWHFRLPLTVQAAGFAREAHPAEVAIDFTQAFSAAGSPGSTLDLDSLRVIEVDAAHTVRDDAVVFQFDPDATYDATSSASGTLVLLLTGTTPADGERFYHIYFDQTGGSFSPPAFASQVAVSEVADHEGSASYRIDTSNSTYYYHKQGAGFASMEDSANNDWIGFHHDVSRSGGEFRGIPNLGVNLPDPDPDKDEWGHAGFASGSSTLRHQGPLKATIFSEATGGEWSKTWEIYPTHATMTLLTRPTDGAYWLLYEGVPGGGEVLEAQDYYGLSANPAVTRSVDPDDRTTSDIAGLDGLEWAYFGDTSLDRVLFLAHPDDAIGDTFWELDGKMTVFGFGRPPRGSTERLLSTVPASLTIGFAETTNSTQITSRINAALQPLTVEAGTAEGLN